MILPGLKSEYGPNKRFDLVIMLNQGLMDKRFPELALPSVEVEADGSIKLSANLIGLFNIETEDGKWETARTIYLTIKAKAKFSFENVEP